MNVVNIVPMRASPPPPPGPTAHVPVLLEETLRALEPRSGATYVDATLGLGGHSEAILSVPGTKLIALDRDELAIARASRRLATYGDRFVAVHADFGSIARVLGDLGLRFVDGILADVGVSSMQLDDPARGMSFRHEGPLDMRMDQTSGETALELIDRLDDDELADVIFRFGDERRSRRVARCIKQALAAGDLVSTLDLRRAVVRAVGPSRVGGVDPSTRTFQALRIAVNGELDQLSSLLSAAPDLLAPGGTLAVISFHSLEDRLVKRAMADRSVWQPLTKKPVVASELETTTNPRSRSAKLRAAHRAHGDAWDAEEPQA
jgi:16S rRNA (cytosine1402-N4)-methyltransferase